VDDLKVLGTITRSHGLKGAFKINVYAKGVKQLQEDEPVFILLQGGPVPFFVEQCSSSDQNNLVLKVECVDSVEQADKFIGCEVLLESDQFEDSTPDTNEELIGFEVFDAVKGDIGAVAGFMDTPQHPIMEVVFNGNTILIPWVEHIVKEIDEEKKIITVEAPDGLIDLYING
jgi:16S rRNA processing protein RimM